MFFFKPQPYAAELFTSSIRCGWLLQPPSAKCHMTNKPSRSTKMYLPLYKALVRTSFFPLALKHSWFYTEKWLQLSHCAMAAVLPTSAALTCSSPCPAPSYCSWCMLANWGTRRDRWKHPARLGGTPEKKCSPQQDPAEKRLVRGSGIPVFPNFQALELVAHMSPLAEVDTHTKFPPAFEWELMKYADPFWFQWKMWLVWQVWVFPVAFLAE